MAMPPIAPDLLNTFALWPDAAQSRAFDIRTLCWRVAEAADIGALSESLKWGQPAWRPLRSRTGSTLRLSWDANAPQRLDLFVDCKTDLAARVIDRFPAIFGSDGRRRLTLPTDGPLPEDALWFLAEQTLTYHRTKAARASA